MKTLESRFIIIWGRELTKQFLCSSNLQVFQVGITGTGESEGKPWDSKDPNAGRNPCQETESLWLQASGQHSFITMSSSSCYERCLQLFVLSFYNKVKGYVYKFHIYPYVHKDGAFSQLWLNNIFCRSWLNSSHSGTYSLENHSTVNNYLSFFVGNTWQLLGLRTIFTPESIFNHFILTPSCTTEIHGEWDWLRHRYSNLPKISVYLKSNENFFK